MNPVVAVLLGTVILGEPLTWRTLVGGGVILASVALIVGAPKPRGAPSGGGPPWRHALANLLDMTVFDLRNIRVRSGEEHREAVEVAIAPIELGGERYVAVPEKVPARALRHPRLHRHRPRAPALCAPARAVRALPRRTPSSTRRLRLSEYQATSPDTDELTTPYLVDDRLDLSAWARDALILALPDKILCRPDCAGLCPVCGRDLNREPHVHEEEEADPRWAALQQLKHDL